MIKKFKNRFIQGSFLTIIWLMILISLTFGIQKVELNYFWRIIRISMMTGGLFSVMYTYIWNYGTWTAPVNIAVTSLVNFFAGVLAIYTFSRDLFGIIMPYWWMILTLTIVLHIVIFYFWSKYQNDKIAAELNNKKVSQ